MQRPGVRSAGVCSDKADGRGRCCGRSPAATEAVFCSTSHCRCVRASPGPRPPPEIAPNDATRVSISVHSNKSSRLRSARLTSMVLGQQTRFHHTLHTLRRCSYSFLHVRPSQSSSGRCGSNDFSFTRLVSHPCQDVTCSSSCMGAYRHAECLHSCVISACTIQEVETNLLSAAWVVAGAFTSLTVPITLYEVRLGPFGFRAALP